MKKRTFYLLLVLLWVVQMAAAIAVCGQKQGFHEDEYYTYYSTARTNGFYVEDGKRLDRDTIRKEFVVLPGEQFRYGLVKQVQSWDVHPPVYYWIFHTVASLVPGVFSKWIGLSVNLVCHGINLLLLAGITYQVSGGKKELTLLVNAFYFLTPAALSGVVFIRMYELLTLWILLSALLHVIQWRRLWQSSGEKTTERLSVRSFLLPMCGVTYLGFLTHYYYAVFACFLSAAFLVCLYLRERTIRNALYYVLSQGAALVLAVLTYPACLGQMFRGQRGAQATENFFQWSNTWERLVYFYRIMDEYVFGNYLVIFWVLLAVLILGALFPRWKQAGSARSFLKALQGSIKRVSLRNIPALLLFAASFGYFAAVSKTGLMYEGTSLRYQLPVYGILVMLLLLLLEKLWKGKNRYVILLCLLLIDINSLAGGKVQFLYPEAKEQVQTAAQKAQEGAAAIYCYSGGDEWCVWASAQELMQYPEVYFLAAGGESALEEELAGRQELVVYVAESADHEAELERLMRAADGFTSCEELAEEKYCSVYLLR